MALIESGIENREGATSVHQYKRNSLLVSPLNDAIYHQSDCPDDDGGGRQAADTATHVIQDDQQSTDWTAAKCTNK